MQYREALALGLKRYNTGKPCKNGHLADRRTSTRTCVTCCYEARRKWSDENREAERAHNRASKARNAQGYNERSRVRMRAYYRKRAGIPEAAYPCTANCECCGELLLPGKRTHLDHDHVTGLFRGWLCNHCNLGIGMLGDNLAGVMRAAAYLQRKVAGPEGLTPA